MPRRRTYGCVPYSAATSCNEVLASEAMHGNKSTPSGTSSVESTTIPATDGFPLAARVYAPKRKEDVRATLLVHGATAVPQSYYARFATYAATHGMRVVTYDFRGVGESVRGPLRAMSATMLDWAERDARAVIAWTRAHHREPLVCIGHSFGGQILGLIDEAQDVDAAVLVAAQLGYMGHWPVHARVKLAAYWYVVVPALTATLGYLPSWGGLGEELPGGVAREWAAWCRSPGYYMDHVPGTRDRLAAFDKRVLAFSFSDDGMAPRAAVDALVARLERATIDRRHIGPEQAGVKKIGHFGFFRKEHEAGLWKMVLDFAQSAAAHAPAA